jgi:hypothetical protein
MRKTKKRSWRAFAQRAVLLLMRSQINWRTRDAGGEMREWRQAKTGAARWTVTGAAATRIAALTGGFNRRTPAKTELFGIGNTKMMPINTATIGLTWVTESELERRRLSDRGQSPVFLLVTFDDRIRRLRGNVTHRIQGRILSRPFSVMRARFGTQLSRNPVPKYRSARYRVICYPAVDRMSQLRRAP